MVVFEAEPRRGGDHGGIDGRIEVRRGADADVGKAEGCGDETDADSDEPMDTSL